MRVLLVVGANLGAVAFGYLVATHPMAAAALTAAAAVSALAFAAPVTHLTILLLLTVVLPYSVQNRVSGAAGLLPSDLFLLTGLLRAGLVLAGARPGRRQTVLAVLVSVFATGAFLAFVHGIRAGANFSDSGAEFRQLLGYTALIVATPLVLDARTRRPLLHGLLLVGLALGLWGLAQWGLNISFGGAGDVGVRTGVRLTTGGRGQIQGGLFGFPLAVAVSYAALASGALRSRAGRLLVAVTLAVNAAALLFTFERTFWVGAVAAVGFVVLRLGAGRRTRALIATPLLVLIGASALAVAAPAEFTTARERLLSLNQYGSDNSIRYRVIESQQVLAKIRSRPLTGSGLGDTVRWGRPYAGVPPANYVFSHNGYLWLAWKLGLPLLVLLCVVIVLAIAWRGPPDLDPLFAAVRVGGQAALFAVLLIAVTWPSLRMLSVTPLAGVFLAMAAVPRDGASAPR